MTAATAESVAVTVGVVVTFGLVVLGLGCMLWDAWRYDRDLRNRPPEKRAVNRQRLARMHVVDRASYVVDGRFPGRAMDHAQIGVGVAPSSTQIDIYDQGRSE